MVGEKKLPFQLALYLRMASLVLSRPTDGRLASAAPPSKFTYQPISNSSCSDASLTAPSRHVFIKRELSALNDSEDNDHVFGRTYHNTVPSERARPTQKEQQLDITDSSVIVKLGFDPAASHCRSPLLDSLLGFDLTVPQMIDQKHQGRSDLETEVKQQESVNSDSKMTFEPIEPDANQVAITKPGICDTKDYQGDCSPRTVQHRQVIQTCTGISGLQLGPVPATLGHADTQIRRYLNWDSRGLSSTQADMRDLLINKQMLSSYFKLELRFYLNYLQSIELLVNQAPSCAMERSPPDLGFPRNTDNISNGYEPLSSPLKNSLLGFTKYFGSKLEIYDSSPNLNDLSNTPAPYSGNTQLSNTADASGGSAYGPGQHVNPYTHELNPDLDLTLTQLDLQLVRLGIHLGYQAALRHQGHSGNPGVPQNYIPYPFSMSPSPPIPLPDMHSDQHYPSSSFSATSHSWALGTQPELQHFFSIVDPNGTNANDLYHPNTSTSQPQTESTAFMAQVDTNLFSELDGPLVPNNSHGHPVLSSINLESHFTNGMTMEALDLSAGSASDIQSVGLSSRTCSKCRKVLGRPSDLADHMHTHDRIKREQTTISVQL
ncbi:unnamed protein product [Rhizoctonia solani]|uniref:C2H2-type domain-containing protein n=1 Tax=Rhizoctonia solani TaxID=456999 RepID=A0A8H3BC46_9AGAM|nr:unnamed protein product [Rhizoctonia solani]